MEFDDFNDCLWECALQERNQTDTTWLVPERSDIFHEQLNVSALVGNFTTPIYREQCADPVKPLCVTFAEIREFGVLDTIGGEVSMDG